ncbi:MAG: hypothetical protein HY720_06075 [Planctomycetes bacterium]|nr:hypothetical protein [Planctomycetota bacterium]
MIRFRCSNCDSKLSAPPARAGKRAKCPSCGTKILVPAGESRAALRPHAGRRSRRPLSRAFPRFGREQKILVALSSGVAVFVAVLLGALAFVSSSGDAAPVVVSGTTGNEEAMSREREEAARVAREKEEKEAERLAREREESVRLAREKEEAEARARALDERAASERKDLLAGEALRESPQFRVVYDVEPDGDAQMGVFLALDASVYAILRADPSGTARLFRGVASSPVDYKMDEVGNVRFDDPRSFVEARYLARGLGRRSRGNEWLFPVEEGTVLSRSRRACDGRLEFHFDSSTGSGAQAALRGSFLYVLPREAVDARWDEEEHALRYELCVLWGREPARLEVEIETRGRVMATLQKVYARADDFPDQWIARTVVKSSGGGPARGVRIRTRVAGFSEWSDWKEHPELVPGQTVVEACYPLLSERVGRIRTSTPVEVEVEWSFEETEGVVRTGRRTAKLDILGMNEILFADHEAAVPGADWKETFANAPFLAAWVSRNDPVVKEYAAIASQLSGGVAAHQDDSSARRALQAAYELLARSGIVYQTATAIQVATSGRDPSVAQSVKFPRDTIRDRSGSCIDLAILYASVVNEIGLPPYLAVVPGHCFAAVRLPGGDLAAVEVTGVSKGAASFDEMLQAGNLELQEALADGRIHLLDLRDLWGQGVAGPDLESLPADILARWGIDRSAIIGRPLEADHPREKSKEAAAPQVERVAGTLERGDDQLASKEYFDAYPLDLEQGQVVELALGSADFDAYLIVRSPDGALLQNDDSRPGSLDAGIRVRAEVAGMYVVAVTSARPGERGKYELVVRR